MYIPPTSLVSLIFFLLVYMQNIMFLSLFYSLASKFPLIFQIIYSKLFGLFRQSRSNTSVTSIFSAFDIFIICDCLGSTSIFSILDMVCLVIPVHISNWPVVIPFLPLISSILFVTIYLLYYISVSKNLCKFYHYFYKIMLNLCAYIFYLLLTKSKTVVLIVFIAIYVIITKIQLRRIFIWITSQN